ncbi:MAG: hypothetical protein U0821_27300 [Chloroflexota bacterium]
MICAELWLRALEPIPSDHLLPLDYDRGRLRRIATGATYLTYDRELGWANNPGAVRAGSGQNGARIEYRHDRAGLRADREQPLDPPPGTRRIAAFGDSFTYCQDVHLEDCWTTRLESLWPQTQVLNFGVAGYGPDQAWLSYQRYPDYRPCGVLIGYMTENVHRVVNRFRPFLQPKTGISLSKPRFLLQNGELVLLPNPVDDPRLLDDPAWVERNLGPWDHWYFPGTFVRNPLDFLHVVRATRSAAFRLHYQLSGGEDLDRSSMRQGALYHPQSEAFQIAGRILTGFAREVERRGMTPVVVIMSPRDQIASMMDGRPAVHEPLLRWLESASVHTVDTTPTLVDSARLHGIDAIALAHYTPRGNTVVAQTLSEALPPLLASTCQHAGASPR